MLMLAACGGKPEKDDGAPARADRTRDAPRAPQEDGRLAIVALGDSLTAGLGVDPSESYPAKLQQKLDAAGYHYRVVNAGVSGDTSAQGLNRVDAVRALHPAIAIVALGANDGLRGIPVEQTRRNLDAIITVLRKDGAKVVLAGMQLPPNLGPVYTNQFRDMFRDLAKARNTPLVPFLLEGVGGRRDLNQEDGVHPTAAGYDIVAENVWRTLKPQLDSLQ
jgi:acyl-CoA thioesterase-1